MSTIKVNRIENTSTTSGGIDIDADGHVQFDGLQLPTAGALSNRNLVINGAMQVAQRGTSASTSGFQTIDRFQTGAGGIALTQSQNVLTSGAPYDEGFRYSFKQEVTTASSSATAVWELQNRLEGQTIAQSGWNYKDQNSFITWSSWVKSSLAGTFYCYMFLPDMGASAARNYRFPVTVAANTWTKVTKSIPGDPSLVFNNDNGNGLSLYWVSYFGTDYTGSNADLNTWDALTSANYLPDFAQNWGNTVGATFEVTGVQLEVGSKATQFEHCSYGDDLARCQRYYYEIEANGSSFIATTADGRPRLSMIHPVTMRANPTVTASGYTLSGRKESFTGYNDSLTNNTLPAITIDAEL